jgi:hypothetical protein
MHGNYILDEFFIFAPAGCYLIGVTAEEGTSKLCGDVTRIAVKI